MTGVTITVSVAQASASPQAVRVTATRTQFPPFLIPRQRAVVVTPLLRSSNTSQSAVPADRFLGVCMAAGA